MSEKWAWTLEKVSRKRENVLVLRQLLAEFREAIKTFCEQQKITVRGMAQRIPGIIPVDIEKILEKEEATCTPKIIVPIGVSIGREQLVDEILKAASSVKERDRCLALCSEQVIELVFDLLEAHLTYAPGARRYVFARVFNQDADFVGGVMDFRAAALRALEREDRYRALADVLYDQTFEARVRVVIQGTLSPREVQLEELEERVTPVLTPPTPFEDQRSVQQAIVEKKEQAFDQLEPPLQEALEQFGGRVTTEGVPFVLTPAFFRELEGMLDRHFLHTVRRQIRIVRALLNMASQERDDAKRELIRQELGPEVDELELAIRQFTFAFPIRISELNELQRKTWSTLGKEKEGNEKTKGRTRK